MGMIILDLHGYGRLLEAKNAIASALFGTQFSVHPISGILEQDRQSWFLALYKREDYGLRYNFYDY